MAVALSDDFQAFLSEYYKLNTVAYDAFKDLWRACGMVRLLYACPPAITQAHYMQVCYSTALAFLMVDQPFNIRAAVIYILYFLHATQPRSCSLPCTSLDTLYNCLLLRVAALHRGAFRPPTESRISVCPVVWQAVLAVEKSAQAELSKVPALFDLLAIMQIMRRTGAFLFSVAAQIPPTANQQQHPTPREDGSSSAAAAGPAGGAQQQLERKQQALAGVVGASLWQRGVSADVLGDVNAPARLDTRELQELCRVYAEAKRSVFSEAPRQFELHSLTLIMENALADIEAEKTRFATQRSGLIANSVALSQHSYHHQQQQLVRQQPQKQEEKQQQQQQQRPAVKEEQPQPP